MTGIPKRLLQAGRKAAPSFDSKELLFMRLCAKHYDDGKLNAVGAIRFPEFSVNRGKFSEPEDVLLPDWGNWGIVGFSVGDVRSVASVPQCSTTEYTWDVVHVPQEMNFSHSEVRCCKNGKYTAGSKIKNTPAKHHLRMQLLAKTMVLREPR